MELYDYSLLLKAIKTINTNNVLLESDRVNSLKIKLSLLENKLINSGILEDWYALSEIIKESGANGYAKVNYANYNAPKMHIEKIFEVYEEYRQHTLDVIAEAMADRRKKGINLANEIKNIKTFIIKEV